MAGPEKITLGGRTFEVKRPKLGQLRRIVDALDEMAGKDGGAIIDPAVALLIAGFQPTHPEVTADELLDLEITIGELNDAVAVVLRAAGLRPTDAEPGEAAPQLAAN